MGKGSLFFGVSLFSLLLIVNFVSSLDTIVQVETYPNHKLELNFLKASPLQNLETFRVNSDAQGKAEIKFSTTQNFFDINAFVKSGTEVLVHYRFNEVTAGENVLLKLYKDNQEIVKGIEIATNTTLNNTSANSTNSANTTTQNDSVIENDTAPSNAGITGLAADDIPTGEGVSDSPFGRNLYYVLGAIILIAIIVFVVFKIRKKSSWTGPSDVKVRKLSDPHGEKEKMSNYTKAIEDAERKINEAQAEIRKIKNQDRISEMRKRIDKEQQELRKLEKGEF